MSQSQKTDSYQIPDDVDIFSRRGAMQRRPSVRIRRVNVGSGFFDEILDDFKSFRANGIVQRRYSVVVGLRSVG